jgi:hypothetical protein
MHILYIRIPSSDWKITAATVNERADEAYKSCSRSQDGNVPWTAFVLRLQSSFFFILEHGVPTAEHRRWRIQRCSGHSAQNERLALEITFYENPITKFMIRIIQIKLPLYKPWRHSEEMVVQLHLFLFSLLDASALSASRLGRFIREKELSCTYWIGGWVSPRTGLALLGKR